MRRVVKYIPYSQEQALERGLKRLRTWPISHGIIRSSLKSGLIWNDRLIRPSQDLSPVYPRLSVPSLARMETISLIIWND
jgi:hypothetical protein